ncbi:MAG: hypothetical protein ACD_9C00251G0006, partial [uncultured bacterium]
MRFILKKINKYFIGIGVVFVMLILGTYQYTDAQTVKTMGTYAYIVDDKNEAIENGEYEVRFGIYRSNRNELDPYPSDSDSGSRIWSETQTVKIESGLLNAQLGTVVALPQSLNFFEGEYYLGMRIGKDSEMVPRKKIGAVPQAISAINLQGATLGEEEGNIVQLGNGGKIDSKFLSFGNGADEIVAGDDERLHQGNTDTGTDSISFNMGMGNRLSGNKFDIKISGDTNKPALRFDGGQGKWMFSNDGVNFQAMGEVENILSIAQGGTGNDAYAFGDILYYESGSTLSRLPIGLNGQVLAVSGGEITWASSAPLSPHDILSVGHSDAVAATAQNGDLLIAVGSPARWNRLGGGTNGQVLTMSGGIPVWNSASSSALHEFLSPTHTDVSASAPVRGAIISGQGASATWAVLNPTLAGQFLSFNGTDAVWIAPTKSNVGLANVENTALSTWTGSANLTNVGTIASGTWNGSTIGAQYGGTGINTSASTGVPTVSSGAWSVVSQLGVGSGGTGINGSAAANGSLLIGNGSGYSLATLTAGSGIGITNGAGSITIANNGVTSLNGTANQVVASGSTGEITLSLSQDIATTSSPTFAGLTLAYDGTHTGGLTVDSSGNLSVATTTGYTKFNKAATQNYLQVFDSTGGNYLQLTHNGTNALIATNTGSLELGTSGDLELASGVNIVGDGNFKIKGDVSSRTITIGDTVKDNDDIVTIDASNWSVSSSGMINGTIDGVGTKVVGANVTDGAFTGAAINGLTAVDSSTGRFYYRYGEAWHYAAQAGGFQIPNYEVAPSGQLSQQAIAEGANSLPFESSS